MRRGACGSLCSEMIFHAESEWVPIINAASLLSDMLFQSPLPTFCSASWSLARQVNGRPTTSAGCRPNQSLKRWSTHKMAPVGISHALTTLGSS